MLAPLLYAFADRRHRYSLCTSAPGFLAWLAQGALKTTVYEIKDFLIPDVNIVPIPHFSGSLSPRGILTIEDEVRMAGHPALSSIILDVLKLTEGEHDAGYEAVISLVETRLKKASSV